MSGKKLCIIIPIYKEKLNKFERLSIQLVQQKLSGYDTYFITYNTLNVQEYRVFKSIKVKFFPKKYFKSTRSYSRMLLNPAFYKCFADYRYMLIVQTDALILGDSSQLEKFMEMDYDYWGARWKKPVEIGAFSLFFDRKREKTLPQFIQKCRHIRSRICYVGNGGLSLRNIDKTIALLEKMRFYAVCWLDNEDKFFAYYGLKNTVGYKLAPIGLVDEFSLEDMIKEKLGRIATFGVHGWDKTGRLKVMDYLRNRGILFDK